MNSSCADGKGGANHALCLKNGKWGYEISECGTGEKHWRQILRACKLHQKITVTNHRLNRQWLSETP